MHQPPRILPRRLTPTLSQWRLSPSHPSSQHLANLLTETPRILRSKNLLRLRLAMRHPLGR